jgi:hypothetical protein
LEYLKAFGEQFSDHVSFMTEFPRMRPSDVKKEWVAQAMTINARMHGLTLRAKDGQIKEVRCGGGASRLSRLCCATHQMHVMDERVRGQPVNTIIDWPSQ